MEITYNPILVGASILIAIVAAFTALRITSNLRALNGQRRKSRIVQGAFALGGGIWSMHFVGMLSIRMPIEISYALLPTLGSALIAILVVGTALLSLHFGIRSRLRIAFAGSLTGIGIVSMHYLGMTAISANCIVTSEPVGVLIATAIGIIASIAALEMAYRERTVKSAILGSVILGLAISAMHYSAIFYTVFSIDTSYTLAETPFIGRETLAVLISVASFVIFGVFLLLSVNIPNATHVESDNVPKSILVDRPRFDGEQGLAQEKSGEVSIAASAAPAESVPFSRMNSAKKKDSDKSERIPYSVNKTVHFISASAVFSIQADGHYTTLYNGEEELFCPLSISKLEERLNSEDFLRTHRSYLVNKSKIKGFRRDGDKGFVLLDGQSAVEAPVSRGRLSEVRKIIEV